MKILGTKFFGHDNSVFFIDTEKRKAFAISNERITRIKHDRSSIKATINEYSFLKDADYVVSGYAVDDSMSYYLELLWLDVVYNYFKPNYIKDLVKINNSFTSKMELFFNSLFTSPQYREWLFNWVKYKKIGIKENFKISKFKIDKFYSNILSIDSSKISRKDHHLCHAIAAYTFSPYKEGEDVLSFTIDGIGDGSFSKLFKFTSMSDYVCIADSTSVNTSGEHSCTSIGFVYSDFTRALDLIPDSDEGKVEALAAFGKADEDLLKVMSDMISFDELIIKINPDTFSKVTSQKYLKSKRKLIGDENFAATVQTWLENIIVMYLNRVYEHTMIDKICLSGGVAANIIMSLNIYERTNFKNIYVLPAMGDDGIAAGAAILKANELGQDISWLRREYKMPYLGDAYSRDKVLSELNNWKDKISFEDVIENWPEEAARSVSQSKIVSLFHGREEYGPRALGNRSIIANPCDKNVAKTINVSVKRRPLYQPFCPSILEEERERLFESSFPHKHMAIAFRMKSEFWDKLPSAIHIDGTARPQFVEREDNPYYYRLINEVKKYTGFGVVINTSFNLHGRTMVHTPMDAIVDFLDCNIDELYIEGFKVVKK
jgi:carbamoyltransferase